MWQKFPLKNQKKNQKEKKVFHTISIWLTLTLAVWRYIAVAHPARNHEWCNMRTTLSAILSGYLICPLLCIPLYLTFSIQPSVDAKTNATYYVVNLSDVGKLNNDLLKDINFWVSPPRSVPV
ncbi:putative G-protein coupled receptor 139 [Frankliniella fusca]|uniref:G-protein coupled receptor 139 n=1 Tax=Frankliniella fusca TaxID=407009 RepID=A0AAE1H6D9_9NEOP|nr:putative G-protein coupled receptor 139 [Frankliniella fusca]